MKGYKVFNSDWTCRGFQYKVGEMYEHKGDISICEKGFHFCREIAKCFNCCHRLSEGGLQGLLEQRLLIPNGEEKQGRLTAETVFNRWRAYFDEEVIPF